MGSIIVEKSALQGELEISGAKKLSIADTGCSVAD